MQVIGALEWGTRTLASMLVATVLAPEADAIPAFTRKHDVQCSACHEIYPKLSPFGRAFKEAGFVFPGEEVDWTRTIKKIPLSARSEVDVTVRDGREDKFYFVKPILAGVLGSRISFWVDRSFGGFSIESVDGLDGSFDDFGTDNAWVRFNAGPAFYIKGGKFELDLPYSLRRNYNLFPYEPWTVRQAANATVLGMPQQGLEVGGSHASWHYSVALAEGENFINDNHDADIYLRVARDIGVHRVGGFYYSGTDTRPSIEGDFTDNFQRYGFDAEARIGRLDLHGVWMRGTDERPPAGAGKNSFQSGFVQVDVKLSEPLRWVNRLGFTDFEGGAGVSQTNYYLGLQYWAVNQRLRLAVEHGWLGGDRPDTLQFACTFAF